MSYIDVFGGSTVQPSDVSYRAVALAASVVLQWPTNSETATDVVARIMDVTPAAGSLTITMPPATEVGNGEDVLFRNLGASTFTVLDDAGGTIIAVASGEARYVYLTSNATDAGVWRSIQFGTGTSSADAAALQGFGILAIGSTLNQSHPAATTTTVYTLAAADRAQLVVYTAGSALMMVTSAATLGNNWFTLISNQGSGALTVTPSGGDTIDGASTLTLNPGETTFLVCGGAATFYTVGRGRSVSFTVSILTKSVAGSSNVTLTAAEAANILQIYNGALTGNISVIVPTAAGIFYVFNNTSGSYTLTVKTAAGTGIVVPQATRTILYCDGTNVVAAVDITATSAVLFSDGSTGAPSITFSADTDTGIYRATSGTMGFSANGTNVFTTSPTGTNTTGSLQANGIDVIALIMAVG